MSRKLQLNFVLRLSIVVIFTISLCINLVPKPTQASDEFSYSVLVKYVVGSDGNTRVEETYNVTNRTPNRYLSNIQLSTPTDEVNNLNVQYGDGTDIPTSVEKKATNTSGFNYEYQQININFPARNVGQNLNWNFTVTYETSKLVETKGGAHTVYIPAISQDSGETYTVELTVPESFGQLHTSGPQPVNLGTSKSQTTYKFNRKDLIEKSLALSFGDSTVYKINFNFPLNNTSNFTQTYTVTLPPNTSGQKVLVSSLDPQPKSTRLDADGNVLADYDVPAKTNITVKTDVQAIQSYLEYDLSASGTQAQIPKDLVARYTSPKQYWPADNPQIVQKAKELTTGKKTVAEQVKAINDYVVATLNYNNEKIKYNIRQGGQKALINPNNAVCLEYSDLMISMLRAVDIPARMPIGYGYSGSLKQSNTVSDSLHSWAQAYIPNIGWMNLDPTWNEKFKNFGYSDLDHVAFAIWGEDNDSPAPVMQAGKDINYQYENTTIEFQALPSNIKLDGQLRVAQWVILPFVAIAKYDVATPSASIADNYALRVKTGTQSREINLGTLAPQQKITKIVPVLGLSVFGNSIIDFNQQGENSLILATTKIQPQSWPMWVLLFITTGIIIYKVVKSKSKKSKKTTKKIGQPTPTVLKVKEQTNEQITKKPPAK